MNPSLVNIAHILFVYISVITMNVVLQRTSIRDDVTERINVIKSANDDRNYRYLILKNKLKILLVSDPTVKKGASAVSVNVGHSSDAEVPGIAHFCEHMLFLGTKKYPKESGFDTFLAQHNGRSNAFTSAESTTFYFDINADSLGPALDRFAQFFVSPSFDKNSTDRELNAIDQEYQKNVLDDSRRIAYIERASSKPGHPYGNFGTGNIKTLKTVPMTKGINVRNKLLGFYKKYYSANIMTASIIGKQTLDELESISVQFFKNVKNTNIKLPSFKNNLPYGKDQLEVMLKIPTLKEMNRLELKFEIFDLKEFYKEKTIQYILRLLGHEGKDSLLSLLKKKGWAYTLLAGDLAGLKGFEFIYLRMDLTKDGMDHVDDIINTVFQYINMLRKEGPKQWVFDEMKTIAKTRFRFSEKVKSQRYAQMLVNHMHSYAPVDVLYGPYRYEYFDSKLIERVIAKLVPDNLRYLIASKRFKNQTNNHFANFYNTGYVSEKIPQKKIKEWKNIGFNKELALPLPNPYIPDNLEIVVPRKHKIRGIPALIKDAKLSRVWYKADDTFHVPKTSIRIVINSPFASLTPSFYNHLDLLFRLVRCSLAEFVYDAKLANIRYEMYTHSKGIYIKIDGYSNRLDILLNVIIAHITSLKIDPKLFQLQRKILQNDLMNRDLTAPYHQTRKLLNYIMIEKTWNSEERLRYVNEMTDESLYRYMKIFFKHIYIESLFSGNILKNKALKMIRSVEHILVKQYSSKPMLPIQHSGSREYIIPLGSSYLYQKKNRYHEFSAVQIYLQVGLRTVRNTVLCQLLSLLMHIPIYAQLRTQQQLGYIVFSGLSESQSVMGIRIQVQTDRSPALVIDRIELFLRSFSKKLKKMSEKHFRNIVASSIINRKEIPKTVSHEASLFAYEIVQKLYNFHRKSCEIKELRKLKKKDIVKFYKRYVDPASKLRKKLAIILLGKRCKSVITEEYAKQWTVIDDISSFKTSLPLYQNLLPVNGVSLMKT